MRKPLALFSVLVLALALMVGSVHATPVNQLAALSDYFPEDTLAFAAIRTDDAFFETLDGFIGMVNQNLGGMLPPGFNTHLILDEFARSLFRTNWDTSFDPWLGNSIAAGLLSFDMISGEPVALVAFEVTDRAAAEAVAAEAFPFFEADDQGDYTLYRFDSEGEFILISDSVLLMSMTPGVMEAAFNQEGTSLSDNPTFNNTLAALPEDSYHIIAYVDAEAINNRVMEALAQEEAGVGLGTFMVQESATGTAAMGFTILDARNLVLDTATFLTPESAAMLPFTPGYVEQFPINPDFARHIPASAQFVLHDNGFGPEFLAFFDGLNVLGPILQSMFDAMLEDPFMRDSMNGADELLEALDLSVINFGGALENYLITLFAGFTGLHLEDDVLSWMTGDYAAYLRILPLESKLNFTLDSAFIVEATDPEAVTHIIQRLTTAAELYHVNHRIEENDAGDTLVFPGPIRKLLEMMEVPAPLLNTPELDVLFGTNGDVFAIGTRPGTQFALEGADNTLLDDPVFQYAAETLFLPDTVSVMYISFPRIVDILPALTEDMGPDAQLLSFAFSQIESMTITGTPLVDGTGAVRFTISIPQAVLIDGPTFSPPQPTSTPSGLGVTPPTVTVPTVTVPTVTVPTIVPPLPTGTPDGEAIVPADALTRYAGLEQGTTEDGFPILGSPDAPVIVEVYSSFSCIHCNIFQEQAMSTIIEMTAAGQIAYVYIPLATGSIPNPLEANRAALCAAEQGAFWAFYDTLFAWADVDPDPFHAANFQAAAAELGLIGEDFAACQDSDRITEILVAASARSSSVGIVGTPSFVVNGEHMSLVSGDNLTDLLAAIESAAP